ncbi:MAG TPA: DUF1475 family protein [Verrucomicrobiae bacterium]|nr:DUF1475 family protein [Verrucomicrobiae bacterium]
MRFRLAVLSFAALAALIGVSIWATDKVSIAPAIADLVSNPGTGNNPWFVATVADAYFGFLWFWAWIAYKETSNVARGVWLVLVLALGNMAMAAYMLLQLRKLPPGAGAETLLLRAK